MATLTFTLVSANLNGGKTYNASNDDIDAAATALIRRFSPRLGPPLTAQQAFLAWSQWCVNDLKGMVKRQRKLDAVEAVTGIDLT